MSLTFFSDFAFRATNNWSLPTTQPLPRDTTGHTQRQAYKEEVAAVRSLCRERV